MREFVAMGGYGGYVWAAFGFAALVLVGLLVQSWRAARRRQAELEQLRHVVPRRRRAGAPVLRPTRPEPGLSADSGSAE